MQFEAKGKTQMQFVSKGKHKCSLKGKRQMQFEAKGKRDKKSSI